MTPLPPHQLVDALKWRYATKKFDSEKTIPEEIWAALEQSLVLAPSSMGLQPWKFFVIRDPEMKKKLVPISHGQSQPVDCSHYVVFTFRKDLPDEHIERYLERIREIRGISTEAQKGHHDMIYAGIGRARQTNYVDLWQSKQIYIALGQFMAAAAVLGVDTCPMEGIEKEKYDELLGLQAQGLTTLVCCAAGYRSAADKYASIPKVRFKSTDVVTYI